ncbi:MAG: CcmD family protein [Bacteroidota bacterium]
MIKRSTLLFVSLLLTSSQLLAQANTPDFFRSIGKIYVVVAVIVAIFIGIVCFLIYLDRKLTNLEHQISDHE